MAPHDWRRASVFVAVCLLAAGGSTEASVATGKEAYFSPLRPVVPTHLPRFAFRSPLQWLCPSACLASARALPRGVPDALSPPACGRPS